MSLPKYDYGQAAGGGNEDDCGRPCGPLSRCTGCAEYWQRMEREGFWNTQKNEWTEKGWREMEEIYAMSSWHSYPHIWALGHRYLAELFHDPVIVEEKMDGCVEQSTPILMEDLSWQPASSLKVGDRLIGISYTDNRMRLTTTQVTSTCTFAAPALRVKTSMGNVVVTRNHPFWVRPFSNNHSRWMHAEHLRKGYKIAAIPVWRPEATWEAGYLAGQYDGEGSLVRHGRHQRVLSYYQRLSESQEYVKQLLLARGFKLRGNVRRRQPHWSDVWQCIIVGGWAEILRFLGTMRPVRLSPTDRRIWQGGATNGLPKAVVLAVEEYGKATISSFSTDIHTYFAGGLASHNSQFNFGLFDSTYRFKSRAKEIDPSIPGGQFRSVIDFVSTLPLHDGWTYRGEAIIKPKHNTLCYERIPKGGIILFDISTGQESYLLPKEKEEEAARLGLEVVPLLYSGRIRTPDEVQKLLTTTSCLGNVQPEGVVVKNYSRFGIDKHVLMGKYVTEKFKEAHKVGWKGHNRGSMIERIINAYKTEARWDKAVRHLRDCGELLDAPQDIGNLIQEVRSDLRRECKDEIMEVIFHEFWKDIERGVVAGLPEWYKQRLLEKQFETVEGAEGGKMNGTL